MYFPTSAARQLSTVPVLPQLPPEPAIAISPSPNKSLFCILTKNGLAVWRVRVRILSSCSDRALSPDVPFQPSAVLAYLSRTPTSLIEHGENVSVRWSPDGRRAIIQVGGNRSECYVFLPLKSSCTVDVRIIPGSGDSPV